MAVTVLRAPAVMCGRARISSATWLAQVNYCQGMAFVAGVILMYLPEEPAFRMLMSLMAESGTNLRRLFTPGLEGLMDPLCHVLYDVLRPAFITLQPLEELCELVDILKHEVRR